MTGPGTPSGVPEWLQTADRNAPWESLQVAVLGLGVSGFAAADALQHLGAHVTVLADSAADSEEKASLLEILGVKVRIGAGATTQLPDVTQLVVTSPGLAPHLPVFALAAERGLPVWGEPELAWRLRAPQHDTPWLCVTGTNGKTTTVQMLDGMLRADGLNSFAAGNVGLALCEVVMNPEPYDVVAVELSSHQLFWSDSLSPHSATVLNVARDHLSWHGDMAAYSEAKAKVYHRCRESAIYNVEDKTTLRMVEEAEVVEGCRAIGFTVGIPAMGMVGIVDDVIADRAFIEGRERNAAELARVDDVPTGAPHNIANALAATTMARSFGVDGHAVRTGLQTFQLDRHRIEQVAVAGEVTYVDDSKATNPHAALASLQAFDSVVWLAGGLAKGATFDDLVQAAADLLRGAVLFGADRAVIAEALARHAPEVPVIEVPDTDTGAMERVVDAATRLARAGDTVLLAPACASQDMFVDYKQRGDAFVAAVRALPRH
jgi:UDP-N-acetylmuramoylalanine--D-glutamate ligase